LTRTYVRNGDVVKLLEEKQMCSYCRILWEYIGVVSHIQYLTFCKTKI